MEKLTINNMLSWKDIISLGNPFGEGMNLFIKDLLKNDACDSKYMGNEFEKKYNELVLKEFEKLEIPIFAPPAKYEFGLLFDKKEDGTWRATFSKVSFFASLFMVHTTGTRQDYLKFADILKECKDKEYFKEKVIELLRERKHFYIEKIKDIRERGRGFMTTSGVFITNLQKENAYCAGRNQINWFIKNYDTIYEFLDRDYPMELLEYLNKDKFMCLINSFYRTFLARDLYERRMNHSDDQALKDRSDEEIKRVLNYINNYLLIADYISEENKEEYNYGVVLNDNEKGIFNPDTRSMREYYKQIMNMIDDVSFIEYSSYEELLSARASETWKRITNKKLVMNIKVNFEMIKSGKKDVYNMDRKAPRVTSSKEKRSQQLQQAYALLDEKFEYYASKNPVITLSGISNFVGYFAQFYENGCVVLDKYYRLSTDRKGKEIMVPASGEAIYIMNHKDFANLCQCTKPQLIEEKNNNNPNVDRKNHSKNWKKTLDKVIDGEGYGGLDLNFLDQLTFELTGEKVKRKED